MKRINARAEFTIITTDPNEVMEPLHDRMPVIIEPKDYDRSLQPGRVSGSPARSAEAIPCCKDAGMEGKLACRQSAE